MQLTQDDGSAVSSGLLFLELTPSMNPPSTAPSPWHIPIAPGRLGLEQPFEPEDAEAAAPAAERTIEHALARLFLRLGPPPGSTELDYSPTGSGGGGAQQ